MCLALNDGRNDVKQVHRAYSGRSTNHTKLNYGCLPCAIYFCKLMLIKKKKDVTHIPSVAEA